MEVNYAVGVYSCARRDSLLFAWYAKKYHSKNCGF